MKSIAALALLSALAACSGSTPGNEAMPTAKADTGAAAAPSPADAPDSHAPPRPAAPRTFADWTVACDNGGECSMASLSPEDGDFYAVNLALTREAGPDGTIAVALMVNQDGVIPARLVVDNTPVGDAFPAVKDGSTIVTGNAATAIAYALANGKQLTVRDSHGAVLATLSLAGASASLRYIDAEQHRAGTVTAIVAKGNQPASAVPAAPALPVIVAPPVATGSAQIGATMAADLKQRAGCDGTLVADIEPEAHPLGDGATLVLVPCSRGAYNFSSVMFVLKDGKPAPARIDAASGFSETDAPADLPEVVNPSVSGGVVSSYARGRGLGDCGVEQDFVWDGRMFRLAQEAAMGECRGNPNLLTTWRTQVVRR
ncbi:DUF1176 domain-containing protein [Hephaestia sp. GCM10023244]|uniref:DUF1176 domain-containing protein n=1 Tax=unclassified Hephaestia TaxID=2631281 RepID=UPI0020777EFB|nr:DUF1176 domain-containing protein [Hephaestia sp. MAHUQ-44]MCM8730963.1 DUF1176 domain-containing protein [Hephaestia sp. MAHUQ-44]